MVKVSARKVVGAALVPGRSESPFNRVGRWTGPFRERLNPEPPHVSWAARRDILPPMNSKVNEGGKQNTQQEGVHGFSKDQIFNGRNKKQKGAEQDGAIDKPKCGGI